MPDRQACLVSGVGHIDGLLSAETDEDIHRHLQDCDTCRALYSKLTASSRQPELQSDKKEIDYLKKVRKKTTGKISAASAALLILFGAFTYFCAIGAPVQAKDLNYTTRVVCDEWRMDIELTNGKALLVRTEPIYGEANSSGIRPVTGMIVKPYEVFPSPLLESGNDSFMYGTTISSFKHLFSAWGTGTLYSARITTTFIRNESPLD
ncbi:zf-HC2 domain-containing protein [Paenibacillus sp. 1P07SE]|uniref:zf-HC2 domain-containing protein n=1 Tax=Paenibacillus sp. 1P07SE TaxID=3132209 RepID=UPI0039A69FD4